MYEVVLIFNGLGNQMSQYAFYLAKKRFGEKVYYYDLAKNHFYPHNGFDLERAFGISPKGNLPKFCSLLIKLRYSNHLPKKSILRRLLKLFVINVIKETEDSRKNKLILKSKGYYLINCYWGGWNSEMYLLDIEDDVRKYFRFNYDKIDQLNHDYLNRIMTEESVSIHLRRGDYIGSRYDNVCNLEYYMKAISEIQRLLPNSKLTYFVFSDDVEYAKTLFVGNNYTFISNNTGEKSWIDMCLMSNCKHNINANSTFSWWSAWLNNNPKKIIIVPDRWIANKDTPDFYPDGWVKIKSS